MSDSTPPTAVEAPLPPSLRVLKWLVILLTLSMIGGVITVVAVIVTRMPASFAGTGPELPAHLSLPKGATAAAVTFGTGWIAVVTTDDRILIFSPNGALRQEMAISLPAGP